MIPVNLLREVQFVTIRIVTLLKETQIERRAERHRLRLRKREREGDRQTDTETRTHRHIEKGRHRQTQTDKDWQKQRCSHMCSCDVQCSFK